MRQPRQDLTMAQIGGGGGGSAAGSDSEQIHNVQERPPKP